MSSYNWNKKPESRLTLLYALEYMNGIRIATHIPDAYPRRCNSGLGSKEETQPGFGLRQLDSQSLKKSIRNSDWQKGSLAETAYMSPRS